MGPVLRIVKNIFPCAAHREGNLKPLGYVLLVQEALARWLAGKGSSMTSVGQALLTRAAEQFPNRLTDAEEKFLRKIAAGEIADYETSNEAE